MKTLFINTCLREESRTEKLAKYYLKNSGLNYIEVKVQDLNLKALTNTILNQRNTTDHNDSLFDISRQFKEADIIVIATPYYDLSFSALLKDYLENINIVGLTFEYDENEQPRSLSNVKKVVYVTTAGGPIISHKYGYGYVKTMFNVFYKVEDFTYIYAEKLDLIGADVDSIMNEAYKKIDDILK